MRGAVTHLPTSMGCYTSRGPTPEFRRVEVTGLARLWCKLRGRPTFELVEVEAVDPPQSCRGHVNG
jgi:hypothetical protein